MRGGGGGLEPLLQTPPPTFRAQVTGTPEGPTGEVGSLGPPTYVAHDDYPRDVLII